MKAKYSPFTSRLALLLAGAVLGALPLNAQEPWREGRNIAGLSLYDANTLEARVGGRFTSGEYRLPSEAAQLWQAGTNAQAESHFKDMLFVGAFSFEVQHAKDMMGSMFCYPGFYPIDVLEFTPGPKTRQTYNIGGGLAWTGSPHWAAGFNLDFKGINYSKRKDLRHTTFRQEMSFVPSVVYKGKGWNVGASFILEKNSEFIQAEQLGTATAATYYAFLDKGKRFGTYQIWDGSGIHLTDFGVDRLAVNQLSWGGALQASWGNRLYADAEFKFSYGEVGEKGYTWFRFPGVRFETKVLGYIPGNDGMHALRADAASALVENFESVIDRVSAGGVTTPVEYGSNRIYVQASTQTGVSYTYESHQGWDVSTSAQIVWTEDRGTHMYPYLAYDASTMLNLAVQGHLPLGPVTLEAGMSFREELAEDHEIVETDETNVGVVSYPVRLHDWWFVEEEYNDTRRLGVNLNIRYDFTIARRHRLFVEAGCSWWHIFEAVVLTGKDRQTTQLTLGYNF